MVGVECVVVLLWLLECVWSSHVAGLGKTDSLETGGHRLVNSVDYIEGIQDRGERGKGRIVANA